MADGALRTVLLHDLSDGEQLKKKIVRKVEKILAMKFKDRSESDGLKVYLPRDDIWTFGTNTAVLVFELQEDAAKYVAKMKGRRGTPKMLPDQIFSHVTASVSKERTIHLERRNLLTEIRADIEWSCGATIKYGDGPNLEISGMFWQVEIAHNIMRGALNSDSASDSEDEIKPTKQGQDDILYKQNQVNADRIDRAATTNITSTANIAHSQQAEVAVSAGTAITQEAGTVQKKKMRQETKERASRLDAVHSTNTTESTIEEDTTAPKGEQKQRLHFRGDENATQHREFTYGKTVSDVGSQPLGTSHSVGEGATLIRPDLGRIDDSDLHDHRSETRDMMKGPDRVMEIRQTMSDSFQGTSNEPDNSEDTQQWSKQDDAAFPLGDVTQFCHGNRDQNTADQDDREPVLSGLRPQRSKDSQGTIHDEKTVPTPGSIDYSDIGQGVEHQDRYQDYLYVDTDYWQYMMQANKKRTKVQKALHMSGVELTDIGNGQVRLSGADEAAVRDVKKKLEKIYQATEFRLHKRTMGCLSVEELKGKNTDYYIRRQNSMQCIVVGPKEKLLDDASFDDAGEGGSQTPGLSLGNEGTKSLEVDPSYSIHESGPDLPPRTQHGYGTIASSRHTTEIHEPPEEINTRHEKNGISTRVTERKSQADNSEKLRSSHSESNAPPTKGTGDDDSDQDDRRSDSIPDDASFDYTGTGDPQKRGKSRGNKGKKPVEGDHSQSVHNRRPDMPTAPHYTDYQNDYRTAARSEHTPEIQEPAEETPARYGKHRKQIRATEGKSRADTSPNLSSRQSEENAPPAEGTSDSDSDPNDWTDPIPSAQTGSETTGEPLGEVPVAIEKLIWSYIKANCNEELVKIVAQHNLKIDYTSDENPLNVMLKFSGSDIGANAGVDEFIRLYDQVVNCTKMEHVDTKVDLDPSFLTKIEHKYGVVAEKLVGHKYGLIGAAIRESNLRQAKQELQQTPGYELSQYAEPPYDAGGPRRSPSKESTSAPRALVPTQADLAIALDTCLGLHTDRGTKILIYQADITKLSVQVIVNAANEHLKHGGGLAYAIAKAAGPELTQECNDHISYSGTIPVSKFALTTAGNLAATNVLHAVGPRWPTGLLQWGAKNKCLKTLTETFSNIFGFAYSENVSSIAVPAISSGIYGVPQDKVATAMNEALAESVRKFENPKTYKKPIEIHLVDINTSMLQHIQSAFKTARLRHISQPDISTVMKQALRVADSVGLKLLTPQGSSGPQKNERPQEQSGSHKGSSGWHQRQPEDEVVEGASELRKKSGPARQFTQQTHSYTATAGRMSSGDSPKGSHTSHSVDPSTRGPNSEDTCPICQNGFINKQVLEKCRHAFCQECIRKWFTQKKTCPVCGEVYGTITGNQPQGTMTHYLRRDHSLPGYDKCGIIEITYHFPGGTQGPQHPSPGEPYRGTTRHAYLPNNTEGRKVHQLLRQAFDSRLTFTIGTSSTTGWTNQITWNDIHHKTNMYGGPTRFGYPDTTYLDRVQEELAAKGIK